MNREIKFRAWQDNQMLTSPISSNYGLTRFFGFLYEDTPIMQYTGLKDKNGVEIYEADIIDFDIKEWGGEDNIHIVTWDKSEGAWSFGGGCAESDMQFRTIIGNIYENPEHLK